MIEQFAGAHSMKFDLMMQHSRLVIFHVSLLLMAILLSSISGEFVHLETIEWSDVIGEGSIALLTIFWTLAVMMSRPSGKVTNLLVIGLSLITFSAILDLFDEFMIPIGTINWISLFESIPAAIGMLVMSYALYLWHLEQLALNQQLQRRELDYRWHQEIDAITLLYRGSYWKERASSLVSNKVPASIIVIDVVNFSFVNTQYGILEGNRILREIAHLLLMNIRNTDLACRYAGDRFVILLPQTNLQNAFELVNQIERSIENVAFKPFNKNVSLFTKVKSVAGCLVLTETIEHTLSNLNQELDELGEHAA
jgi:diguanylate cyclase (GGDEF)-like protein